MVVEEKSPAVKRETRPAAIGDHRMLWAIRSWFGLKLRGVRQHLLARLRMKALYRFRIEIDVTAHLGERFYKVYRDNADERHRIRKLSYVYLSTTPQTVSWWGSAALRYECRSGP